jgi:hypothetical protein
MSPRIADTAIGVCPAGCDNGAVPSHAQEASLCPSLATASSAHLNPSQEARRARRPCLPVSFPGH